jgi:hypothetical protein
MVMGMMRTCVMSAGVVNNGVMSGVAMIVGSERRSGKDREEERGDKNLLHGTNLTR